ncbi:tetratricopeptide repeat protein [Candidatus Bipolaricaulota bacterium]|nr:tetratricopeptide repeat protein [Candidatus Bipolaricaulota bacterium]
MKSTETRALKSKLANISGKERIEVLNKLAGAYDGLSARDRIAFAEQAIALSERFHDGKSKAEAYNHLGVAYNNIGSSEKSIDWFLKALKIMEQIDNKNGIANSLVNLGQANFYLESFSKALGYFQKALQVREKLNSKESISQSLILLGNAEAKMAEYDRALDYYSKALVIKEQLNDKQSISQIYCNLGNVYLETGEQEKALQYHLKALQIDRTFDNKWEIALTCFNVAKHYLENKEPDKAYPYIAESLEISEDLENKGLIRDNHYYLSLYYEQKKDYRKALKSQRDYSELTKNMFSEELSEKVAEMQTKYETEKLEDLVAERTRELRQKIDTLGRTERALRDSEERLDLALTGAGFGVWDWNIATGEVIYSDQWCEMLGYSTKDIEPKMSSFKNLWHGEDEHKAMEILDAHLEGTTPVYEDEFRMRTKSGEWRWILARGKVFKRDNAGKPLRMVALQRDITESKSSEEALREAFEKLQRTLRGTIEALTKMVATRDPYTSSHQKRVADLACAIAAAMGLPEEQIKGIRVAGTIHDIGKISTPMDILVKPAKLTETEFELVKAHSQTAYDIIKTIEFPWPVANTVLQHHERINGTGYPNGLKGDEMLPEARILAVADVVEAMTSYRPYRPSLGIDQALEEISQNKGILYDSEVVEVCLELFKAGKFKFSD